jgi:hypothetical protein
MAKRTATPKPPTASPTASAGAGWQANAGSQELAAWAYGNSDGMNAPDTHEPGFRGHAIAQQPAGQAQAPVIGPQQMRDFVAANRRASKPKGGK